MELYKFYIFQRQSSSHSHGGSISCASMSRCAGEVASSISTCSNNGLVCSHSVDSSISHIITHNTSTLITIHDEIKSKVFDKEDAIIAKSSPEKSVEHRVTSSICNSASPVSLTASTEIPGLTSESSLIYLTFLGPTEWHTVRFQFEDCFRSFFGHVANGILVS